MLFARSSAIFTAIIRGSTWIISVAAYKHIQLRTMVSTNEAWPIVRDGCGRKRQHDDEKAESVISPAMTTTEFKKIRIRRKMHALLMAYCGQGYFGLQRNIGTKTIEEELMSALKKLEVVNEEEFVKQQLINFQRAARTDKGVSAVRQALSLTMKEGVTAVDINRHLPEQIRVLAVKRVTKGFNSKNSCDARTYSYTCPSFAFAPQSVKPCEAYRITDDVMQNLNACAGHFVGTHNFHNYTSGRKPFDPSCQRHILHAEWKKPIIRDGLELVTFIVKGQSFMLHQIRKMVGILMSVCRGYVEPSFIQKAFSPTECAQLPVAPALGLLLEQVHYDWYNKKYGNNGIHEKLDFVDVEHLVEQFREAHIYPIIMREETEGRSMLTYLDTLHLHYNDYRIGPKCPGFACNDDQILNENVAVTEKDDNIVVNESIGGVSLEAVKKEHIRDLIENVVRLMQLDFLNMFD